MRALMFSLWSSVGFVVMSLLWGIAAGSQMIVFDGLYSLVSIGLSGLAVLADRTAAKGADARYPWGRETWEPVAILVKATALGGLCVYGSVDSVRQILHGGRDVAAVSALTYAVVASAASVAVAAVLYRARRSGGDLVHAEAAEWAGDAALSLITLAGFVGVLILQRTGHGDAARFIDPGLVIVVSVIYLGIPIRLFRESFREILTMAPPEQVAASVAAVCERVRAEHDFAESFSRTSKVGRRLDVELGFVVGPRTPGRDVDYFDRVRGEIDSQLQDLGQRNSTSVIFTAQRKWVGWG